MNITFTGINNVNTGSIKYFKTYDLVIYDQRCNPPGVCTEVDLSCDLTDDENGNNLADFKEAMEKSELKCTDPENPNTVRIKAIHNTVPFFLNGEGGTLRMSEYRINGTSIDLKKSEDKKNLPMLSFIAQLTSKLAERNTLTEDEQKHIENINAMANHSASFFIDKVMCRKSDNNKNAKS